MFRRLSEQNHYQVLEVSYDASSDEIQSAYEAARDIYSHEALVSGSILSEHERRRTFDRISEAYQTLIAEESRRLYDQRLGLGSVRRREETKAVVATPVVDAVDEAPEESPSRATSGDSHDSDSDTSSPPTPPRPSKVTESRECPIQLKPAEEASGAFLKKARESMGLELQTISEETKIGQAMLQYIEEERIERLPAPVYLRNFTRQFARCLGLDEERVARTYIDRVQRLSE